MFFSWKTTNSYPCRQMISNMPDTFGERLRTFRKKTGITQEELADILGMRLCQREYFRSRSKNVLLKSKALEKKVDEALSSQMIIDDIEKLTNGD